MSVESTDAQQMALRVESLVFSYLGNAAARRGEALALNGVSLHVPSGRFVALLGANGAGKTTLFSIVTGLYASHSGSVSVMGSDLQSQTLAALAGMGVVFQRSTLDMDLTVQQNLLYAAALQGIPAAVARQRIDLAVQRHGLDSLAKRKVVSLSGGQRRRVELARALLHEPDLLLLDEPTVGLDLQSRSEFVAHVKSLCSEQGTGVLWATHLLDEIDAQDLVFVIDSGQVVGQGDASDLMKSHDVEDMPALFRLLVESAKGDRAT